MNTARQIAAALITLSAFGPIAVFAGPQPDAPVTRSAQVSLMGIDRSTPDGAHAARERIQQTARRLCAQVADELDLSLHANYLACVDETVTAALRKLTGPAIAAESGAAMKPGVAAAKKDPPTTSSLVSRSAIGSVPSATRR